MALTYAAADALPQPAPGKKRGAGLTLARRAAASSVSPTEDQREKPTKGHPAIHTPHDLPFHAFGNGPASLPQPSRPSPTPSALPLRRTPETSLRVRQPTAARVTQSETRASVHHVVHNAQSHGHLLHELALTTSGNRRLPLHFELPLPTVLVGKGRHSFRL